MKTNDNIIDFDWDKAIAKLYKRYEGIPDDIVKELNWYKKRVTILQFNLKQAKQDIEVASRNSYEKGWNDCVKKIKNFIARHCEDWLSKNDD